MQTTCWFPADEPPVRPGYYEVRYSDESTMFLYWSGERWQYKDHMEYAPLWGMPTGHGDEFWRGLTGRAQ